MLICCAFIQDVLQVGKLQDVLNEMRQILITPIKPFSPPAGPVTTAAATNQGIGGNMTEQPITNGLPHPDDLPSQITRVLGKGKEAVKCYNYKSGFSVQISSGSKNVSTGGYIFSQFSLLTRKLMQKFVLNKSKRNFTATTGGYLCLHNGQNSAGCRLLLRTMTTRLDLFVNSFLYMYVFTACTQILVSRADEENCNLYLHLLDKALVNEVCCSVHAVIL